VPFDLLPPDAFSYQETALLNLSMGVDDGRREGKQCRRAYYFSKMHILDFFQTAGEDWDYLLHLHVDSLKKFFIARKRDFVFIFPIHHFCHYRCLFTNYLFLVGKCVGKLPCFEKPEPIMKGRAVGYGLSSYCLG
jgi:hypothetical protein